MKSGWNSEVRMRRPLFCSSDNAHVMTTLNQNLDVMSSHVGGGVVGVPNGGGSGESRMERMKKILSSPLSRKKSTSASRVFGASLESLSRGANGDRPVVPFVVTRICKYIEKNGMSQEGIFRISGNARLIERLKSAFNGTGDAPLEGEGDVASAAALLKLFLRELAEPVVPSSAQPAFLQAARSHSQNGEQCALELKCLVQQLPEEHFLVLQYLVRFLLRVSLLEDQNRMSASSLGIVFGPNLFRVSDDFSGLKDQAVTNQIVTTLIKNYAIIFEENSNISTQQLLKQTLKSVTEPLSVVIPPMDEDVLTLRGRQGQEIDLPTKQIPVLMVDSFVDIAMHTSHFDHLQDERLNHRVSTPPCRKRKERKFSGEEQQVFRSSSEERPIVDRATGGEEGVYLTVGHQIRRCNSHEEMRNYSDNNNSRHGRRKSSAEMVGVQLQLSSGGKVILTTEEKDLSPHPPKPKRRELEAAPPPPPAPPETPAEALHHHRALAAEQYDFHEMQRNAERMAPRGPPSRSRRSPSSRGSLRKSFSEGMEEDSPSPSSRFSAERRSWTPSSSPREVMEMDCGRGQQDSRLYQSGLDRSNTPPRTLLDQMGLEMYHAVLHRGTEEADVVVESRDRIPHLDLNTLHEHGDGNEPIPSEQRFSWALVKPTHDDIAMLSPSAHHLKKANSCEASQSPSAYKSYFHHRSSLHLDPSLPPSPPVEQADVIKSTLKEDEAMASTVKQLNKKMHSLKKRVKNFEEMFEKEHGFRPSIAEKMNFPEIKKVLLEMNKTRKELRQLKDDGHISDVSSPTQELLLGKKPELPSVEDSFYDALRNLSAKRRQSQRPEVVEDMTQDQIQDEKLAIQKVLLRYESIHGRPVSKGDRDMMRPLYDRYRSVKRLMSRSSSLGALGKGKDLNSDLQPILEHEAMDFTSPQHMRRIMDPDFSNKESQEDREEEFFKEESNEYDEFPVTGFQETKEEMVETPGERLLKDRQLAATSQARDKDSNALMDGLQDSKSSNLHELPLSELMDQQQRSRSEKRRLRRALREFEETFQRQTGRRVQKEDRTPMETVYSEYKHVKARLKLLEALISKHEQM